MGIIEKVKQQDMLGYILLCLNITGINPENQTFFSHIVSFLCLMIMCYCMAMCIMRLYFDRSFESISILLEASAVLYQIFMKLIRMKLKQNSLRKMLATLDAFWPTSKSPAVEKVITMRRNVLHKFFITYFILVSLTCISYCLKPLFLPGRTVPIDWDDGLCDMENFLCYFIKYFIESYNGLSALMIVAPVDAIFIILVFFICEQLYMIKTNLLLIEATEDDSDLKQFYEIIYHHNFMLQCVRDLNAIFNMILFDQIWSSNLLICMGIVLLMFDSQAFNLFKAIKTLLYLSTFIIEIYIYCFFGQMLIDESVDIGVAVFHSKWSESPKPQWRKGVIRVIQMAHHSPEITIGGLWILNKNIFTNVMNNAMSFCALIKSIYSFDED